MIKKVKNDPVKTCFGNAFENCDQLEYIKTFLYKYKFCQNPK